MRRWRRLANVATMLAVVGFSLKGMVAMALLAASSTVTWAQPARIIILRHAEKQNSRDLCPMGVQRADALAKQYLGRRAQTSLFAAGEQPAAMLAITPHTVETITPAAMTWGLSVVPYSVAPSADEDEALGAATQRAAHDVLTDPSYAGKIVVMTWEHKHIANKKLEEAQSDPGVTLRQLLHLDSIASVPKSWSDSNYDFFWVVDYTPGNPDPTGFRMVKQTFAPPFDTLPSNDWDAPEPLHVEAGCKK